MRMTLPGALLLLIAASGCSNLRAPDASGGTTLSSEVSNTYMQLLALYPEEHQGLGIENWTPGIEEQPMTYGLILSAEAARYRRTGQDEPERRIRKALAWLLDNRDLDRDGKPGWGLPQPWDAFQDGSTNPVNQPYTITTAIVLNGMLDALRLPIWSRGQRDEIRKLAAQVAVRWCREMWSQGFKGGYFWYSPSRADDIFAVNSPSMFMGSLARLLHEQADAFAEERQLVQSRADDQARAVVATVQLREGLPFWDYMPAPNKFNRHTPNDLVHHVYTLWGIEQYRDNGGKIALPWTREQARQSLDTFWSGGQIREYPQDVTYTGPQAVMQSRPAILWSTGMLLAAYAQWNDRDDAGRTLAAIQRNYGPWPELRLRPASAVSRARPTTTQPAKESLFYPRHGAHVLWGGSLYAFGAD